MCPQQEQSNGEKAAEPLLAPGQLDEYDKEGFILLESLVEPDRIAALCSEVARLLASAGSQTEHNSIFDFEETHTAARPRVRRIKSPHLHSAEFAALLQHPKLLAACRQLLRTPDLRRGDVKLNLKSAEYGSPVQWHQDWAFYPHTNESLLAIGVFLNDVTVDNGPLLVMPRTHRGPLYSHHSKANGVFVGGLVPSETGLDFSAARPLTGPAGSMSFHHTRLVHGSDLNRSSDKRWIVFIEVGAADAWPLAGASNFDTVPGFFESKMLCGKPCLQPRMEAVPVRMPYPKAADSHFLGSIYASQQLMQEQFFGSLPGSGAAEGNGSAVSIASDDADESARKKLRS